MLAVQDTPQQQNMMHQPALVANTAISNLQQLEVYWKIAEKAHQSGLTKVNTIFDAFFIIGYGQELGISAFASLRTIYVVNGVPTCSGEMMLALIRRSGLAEAIQIEDIDDGAKCTMTRKDTGETVSITFTMKDAAQAGLTGKQVWKSYPKNMCRWRAVSNVAKLLFGDVVGGLYTFEEIADDNQPIDEAGAPVGTIIESTGKKIDQEKDHRRNDTEVAQKNGATPTAETPPEDKPDPQPEKPPEKTWLQEDDHKQWLLNTMTNNGLDIKTFFKQLDPKADGWNAIAKQYPDRKALAKAIFDAMDTSPDDADDTPEEAYDNPFDITDILPDAWDDDGAAYQMLCDFVEQYFDDEPDDIIGVGMGVEAPEQEYDTPLALWDAVVEFATETGINLVCNQFFYEAHGKTGRIKTFHPVLAMCWSRQKFISMINEPQYTDKANIGEWDENEGKPYVLHRQLVISYERKERRDGKTYNLITGATLKPLDQPADLDEFFENS